MIEKKLAKISNARFGTMDDYPFLMGLDLSFTSGDGWGIGCCDKYMVNMEHHDTTKVESRIIEINRFIFDLLKQAKVADISRLRGIPVEIEMDVNLFVGFRILTEVL